MKDMYSFDITKEDALRTYQHVVGAYKRILSQLELDYVIAAGTHLLPFPRGGTSCARPRTHMHACMHSGQRQHRWRPLARVPCHGQHRRRHNLAVCSSAHRAPGCCVRASLSHMRVRDQVQLLFVCGQHGEGQGPTRPSRPSPAGPPHSRLAHREGWSRCTPPSGITRRLARQTRVLI
jgi:hypothetical protein